MGDPFGAHDNSLVENGGWIRLHRPTHIRKAADEPCTMHALDPGKDIPDIILLPERNRPAS
jgi:hypothetical protein